MCTISGMTFRAPPCICELWPQFLKYELSAIFRYAIFWGKVVNCAWFISHYQTGRYRISSHDFHIIVHLTKISTQEMFNNFSMFIAK